jgi:hypothetical protein
MDDNQNIPLKIYHAFEDLYFEKDKGKIFDDIFTRYFSLVEIDHHMDLYDVLVLINTHHRERFDEMVREFKSHSIIND